MSEVVELLKTAAATSEIRRVAIVDDVFDTPIVGPEDLGNLLEFFEKNHDIRASAEIGQQTWDAAIADLQATEHDSEHVAVAVDKLYRSYVETGDSKFDPAGFFARTRGPNLGYLRPLLTLLRACDSLTLLRFGSKAPTVGDAEMPDLVLVDLYLNPAIAPVVALENGEAKAGAELSLARVRPLLKNDPSIILMSSHGEKGKEEAESYRGKLNDRVFASRFGFVDKGHIQKHPELGLSVEDAARDTLLDIFQNYKFGKALSEAMTRWLTGAKDAVDAIGKDIRRLQLKEISYLVQFRLAAEGQGLEEYLEWFFGEALLDYVIRAVDAAHVANPLEFSLNPTAVASIDGSFEPTKSVAKMYHRVRVESTRARPRKNFRLGDLYRDKNKNRVVAVMTPDCDLVLRMNEKKKEVRNAEHLLLVPGNLSDLEKASASVGDFLMIGDIPHNIHWAYKKVFSLPFTGTMERAAQSGDDYEYLGTLRPLYAQEIQASLTSHVGRVGVAVPPIIGLPAISTIVVRTTNGVKEISADGTTFNCSLIPGRASTQPPRVLFDREVIRRIKAALLNMPADDLIAGSGEKIEALKQDEASLIERALKKGPEIGSELSYGVMLATGKRDGTAGGPWCAIYVTQVTMQQEPKVTAAPQGLATPAPEAIPALAAPPVGLVEPEAPVTAQTLTSTLTQQPKKGQDDKVA